MKSAVKWRDIVRGGQGGRGQAFVERGPLSFVMKLTQGGVDVGTSPAPGVETTALVKVTNNSMLGGQPVGVTVTIRLKPTWGSPPNAIAVADQSIGLAGGQTSSVSFTFTFPTASEGLAGDITCQALTPDGVVVATLPLAVTIIRPVTYAASGKVVIYDGSGTVLIPAGQAIQVGKTYIAIWQVTNLSTYKILGGSAPALLYLWMGVDYYKADGTLLSSVSLYPYSEFSFTAGEIKTVGVPAPTFIPPTGVAKAKVGLVIGQSSVGVLAVPTQENPVAEITYNITLQW